MAPRKAERPAERGVRRAETNAVAAYLAALRASKVPARSRDALEKRRAQIEQWRSERALHREAATIPSMGVRNLRAICPNSGGKIHTQPKGLGHITWMNSWFLVQTGGECQWCGSALSGRVGPDGRAVPAGGRTETLSGFVKTAGDIPRPSGFGPPRARGLVARPDRATRDAVLRRHVVDVEDRGPGKPARRPEGCPANSSESSAWLTCRLNEGPPESGTLSSQWSGLRSWSLLLLH